MTLILIMSLWQRLVVVGVKGVLLREVTFPLKVAGLVSADIRTAPVACKYTTRIIRIGKTLGTALVNYGSLSYYKV